MCPHMQTQTHTQAYQNKNKEIGAGKMVKSTTLHQVVAAHAFNPGTQEEEAGGAK